MQRSRSTFLCSSRNARSVTLVANLACKLEQEVLTLSVRASRGPDGATVCLSRSRGASYVVLWRPAVHDAYCCAGRCPMVRTRGGEDDEWIGERSGRRVCFDEGPVYRCVASEVPALEGLRSRVFRRRPVYHRIGRCASGSTACVQIAVNIPYLHIVVAVCCSVDV